MKFVYLQLYILDSTSLVWTSIGEGPKNSSSSEVRLASDLFQIRKLNCHHGWEAANKLYSTVNSDNTSCPQATQPNLTHILGSKLGEQAAKQQVQAVQPE